MSSKPTMTSKPQPTTTKGVRKEKGNSTYLWIIIVIIIVIIIFFVTSWMGVRSQYKQTFDWWDNNNGTDYNKYFNIFTLACVRENNLWYFLSNLSNPPAAQFSLTQYLFILEYLFPYLRYTDPKTKSQMGILTPKSLTRTLLFSSKDTKPDVRFVNWIYSKPKRGNRYNAKWGGGGLYDIVEDPTKILSYKRTDIVKDDKGLVYYFYNVKNNGGDTVNVYPGVDDREGWAGLMLEWLNGTSGDKNEYGGPVMWCYAENVQNTTISEIQPNPNYIPPPATTLNPTPMYANWLVKTTNKEGAVYYGQADNFMSRFGIMADSPIFTFFINNNYMWNGHPVPTDSYKQLVGGTPGNTGGWLGFLQEHNRSWDKEDFIRILDSSVLFKTPPAPPPCKPPNVGHGILTGLTTACSMLAMLAFMITTEGAGAPLVFPTFAQSLPVLIGAGVGATASGINAGMSNC